VSLATLINQACTITTRTEGAKDRMGDPTLTESTTAAVCYCEQRQRSETTVNGDVQAQEWLVMFPVGTAVAGSDLVTVGTLVLEVVGPPWPVRNPRTQTQSHIEATCRMVA
jgi:hypothetical protein